MAYTLNAAGQPQLPQVPSLPQLANTPLNAAMIAQQNGIPGYVPGVTAVDKNTDTISKGPGYIDSNPFAPGVGLGMASIGPLYVESRALSALGPTIGSIGAEASLATVGLYIVISGDDYDAKIGFELNFVGTGVSVGRKTGVTFGVGASAYFIPIDK